MPYELIELQESTPGNKQIISAEELMYNFRQLEQRIGSDALGAFIESTGVHYNPLLNTQLSRAVVQYVLGAYLFESTGLVANHYVLSPKPGYYAPNTYTDGMKLTFINNITNTGASTLRIDGMEDTNNYPIKYNGADVAAGDLAANTTVSIIFRKDSDNSYFELERSANEGSSIKKVENMLANTIKSANLTYNLSNESQLTQALAAYVFGPVLIPDTDRTNGVVYYLNTYPLKNNNPLKQLPVTLSVGQVYHFIPNITNTSSDVTLVLNNNTGLSGKLVNNNGSALEIGQLQAGLLTTVVVEQIFDDNNNVVSSYFKLVTGTLPFLNLKSSYIDSISTDVTFSNESDTSLATTKAIKEYVNTVAHATTPNSISAGTVDSTNHPKYIKTLGDSVIQLVSSADKVKNIEFTQAYAATTPVTPASATSYSSLNDLSLDYVEPVITVAKTGDYCWSSNTTLAGSTATNGYIIDGLARKVVQSDPEDPSTRSVQINRDAARTQSEYLNFNHVAGRVDFVKIKHKEGEPIPERLTLAISLDGTTFYTLCGKNSENLPDYSYANLGEPDSNGYITITVPEYYLNGTTLVEYKVSGSLPLADYSFRITVDEFSAAQVIPLDYLIDLPNINTYNPVTDTDSEITRYAWQVEDVNLLAYDKDIKPLLVTFADGSTLSVYENKNYSILDVFDNGNNTGSVVSFKKPNEYYIVLNGAGDIELVAKENYIISDTDPCDQTKGYCNKPDVHWIDNSVYPNRYSIGRPVEVTIMQYDESSPKYFTYKGVTYNLTTPESNVLDEGDICNITPVLEGSTWVPHPVLAPTTRPTGNNDFEDDIDLYMEPMTSEDSLLQFIIIGEATLTEIVNSHDEYIGTKITSATPYNIGTSNEFYEVYNPTNASNYESINIAHNFGANVSVKVALECLETDNSFPAGTCVELAPYTHESLTRSTSSFIKTVDFAEQTTTTGNAMTNFTSTIDSQFLILSNKAYIILGYKDLFIYDAAGTRQRPTPNKWRFVVEAKKRLN